MKVNLILDSTADLTPALKARCTTVPLTVFFGNEEFIDGVTITHRRFYEKLVESDVLPTTSQASPAAFETVFREVAAREEAAVVLTLSANFSGTCQSARIAAEDFDNIYVVDSGSASIGTGILAELALALIDRGLPAGDIAAQLEEAKTHIRIVAMVDTLEYLQKGGRLSKTLAFAGTLLNIKPVMAVTHGEIRILGKARGSKQGNNLLVQEIEKAGGVDFSRPVLLGYTGLSDALLCKYQEDSQALWSEAAAPLTQCLIGSVIGTHTGPGTVAVAFFAK